MAAARSIEVAKGEKKRIISQYSNSLAMDFTFTAAPLNPGEALSGVVEICGSRWVFPKPAVRQKLQPVNSVSKTAWDTLYSVNVQPDCDVRITLEGSRIPNLFLLLIIALSVSAIAAVLTLAMLR